MLRLVISIKEANKISIKDPVQTKERLTLDRDYAGLAGASEILKELLSPVS